MIRILFLIALLLLPATARADWYEASGKHFIVYSQQTPKAITAFADQLERYDAAMRVMRGLGDRPIDPVNRVTVFVTPDLTVIHRLGGDDARGVYRASVHPAAFVPRVTGGADVWDLDGGSVLRHEYAHHFMFSNFGGTAMPMWLVEGYAEFNATAIFKPDGSVMFGQAPGYRVYGLLEGPALPLKTLFTADSRKLDGEHTDVLYGKSWLLVHYLAFDKTRNAQLGAYISAVNHGQSPLAAASVFGDFGQLDRELTKKLADSRIAVYNVSAAAMKIGTIALRPLTPAEAAMMPIRIETAAGVEKGLAAQLALRARKAAAPKTVGPHVYRAVAAAALARAAKATDTATWAAVRKDLVAANHLDPDDPQPLALFYDSFTEAGQPPTANALAGLRQALALVPSDDDIRWELAFAEIDAKDWPAVRETILPLAYSPHPDPLAGAAAELVAAIDSNDKTVIAAKADAVEKAGTDQPGKPAA